MTIKFIKTGSFWSLPIYKKLWLNFKHWFKGTWMFLRVLANYRESINDNELTILDALSLCHSHQEAQMGKTLSMVKSGEEES